MYGSEIKGNNELKNLVETALACEDEDIEWDEIRYLARFRTFDSLLSLYELCLIFNLNVGIGCTEKNGRIKKLIEALAEESLLDRRTIILFTEGENRVSCVNVIILLLKNCYSETTFKRLLAKVFEFQDLSRLYIAYLGLVKEGYLKRYDACPDDFKKI